MGGGSIIESKPALLEYLEAHEVFLVVSERILKRMVEVVSTSSKEVIGLILGSADLNIIRVLGHYTGPQFMMKTKVRLSNKAMAWIAKELTAQEVRNSLIGWYHSHPGYGVFLSNRDIKTHLRFQSFFPLSLAFVIDPINGEKGFFIAPKGVPLRIPEKNILLKREGEGKEEFDRKYAILRRRALEALSPYRLCPMCHSPMIPVNRLGGRVDEEDRGRREGGLIIFQRDRYFCFKCGKGYPGAALPLCPKCSTPLILDIDKGAFYCRKCEMYHYPIKGIKRITQIKIGREREKSEWWIEE